jgi:hypothetical protein
MNKFRFTIQMLAIATFMLAFASMAQAQASRTWVSGVGDDANPCSRTAPCKTFAGAISKTARFGEINCLDPGGFGAVTITKSITIDCHEIFGSILNASVNAVIVNFDSFDQVLDTRKTVRLRNLSMNGFNTGLNGVRIIGNATNSSNSEVYIEDCLMDGNFGSPGRGILDERVGSSGVVLSVNNTTIRNMVSTGISIVGSAGSRVSISHSLISNCLIGVAVANGPKVVMFDTVVVSNGGPGVQSDGATTIEVDHCQVSNNAGAGFVANGAGSVIRVSNTTAMNNSSLATISAGGAVSSYGNNQTGGAAFPSAGTSPS